MKNEFRDIIITLGYFSRLYLRLNLYVRNYRHTIYMIVFALGVVVLSYQLDNLEKIVIYSLATIFLIYGHMVAEMLIPRD